MTDHRYPTWLALGDSYTIGEGVNPEERWPAQVAQRQGYSSPEYVAKTGWTTADLLGAIASTNFALQYDWVSVLIGVNDQYDGIGDLAYREGLTKVIDFALSKTIAPGHVVVLSIPDYSVTPYVKDQHPERIARHIARFNRIAREVAFSKATTYCDITCLSQQAAHDPTLLAEDGLHPSGAMYRMWVEQLLGDTKHCQG